MPNTILATTDLSARGDRAVRRAMRIARDHGAALTVLHVVDDAMPVDIVGAHREKVSANLRRFLDTIDGGETAVIKVITDDPIAGVVSEIKAQTPDLLVMGTHRVRPFFDGWRETTAQHITRRVDCPVLLVNDADDHDYETVLAATDFSPAASAAIACATALAPKAAITPVHAYHVPYSGMLAQGAEGRDDVAASFRAEARDEDTRWRRETTLPETCGETEFVTGQPRQALEGLTAAHGATLICAGAHGRVGQRRPLLGSTAVDLLRAPPCDVLIVHPT